MNQIIEWMEDGCAGGRESYIPVLAFQEVCWGQECEDPSSFELQINKYIEKALR
jgi:hypothetical protein